MKPTDSVSILSLTAILICFGSDVHGLTRKQQALVTDLPGLTFNPGFKSYSGYLNVSETRFFHYWLVESQRSPSSDPIVLWLSGGPACSSLGNMFAELGPFRVNKDGKTLFENVYTWNKVANVLFLESPADVGFSYSTNGNNATSDNQTAWENFAALSDFFNNVFPEYQNRDFFITGESYAGVYIPTLASIIIDETSAGNFKGNLKGLTIGNGCMDDQKQDNSLVDYMYFHGIIGDEDLEDFSIWKGLKKECCGTSVCTTQCDFYTALKTFPKNSTCHKLAYNVIVNMMDHTKNDVYDIYQDCYNPRKMAASKYSGSSLLGLINGASLMNYQSTDALSGFPCWAWSVGSKYLNIPAVQTALHIPNSFTKSHKWVDCTNIEYHQNYHRQESFFDHILDQSNVSILIYNGDVDMVCNFLGDEWFGNNVSQTHNLKVLQPREPWYYEGQIAGYVKRYERLDIVTVKGAGHFVQMDRPGPALQLFYNFINGVSNISQPNGIDVTPKPFISPSSASRDSVNFLLMITATFLLAYRY